MPPARVQSVAPGSPGALIGIQPGDEILAVNGEAIRDVIRYQVQVEEPEVVLEISRGGLELELTVEKRAGEQLGIELAS